MPKKKGPSFEKALEELNTIVENLEKGDMPIESLIKCYERGIELHQNCQTILAASKQKIQLIHEKNPLNDPIDD